MSAKIFGIVGLLSISSLAIGPVQAQKKPAAKPPVTKATAKPPVKKATEQTPKKQTGPIVLGTTQLPGDFGQFGTTYTIGQRNPINFTLKSAEYTIAPVTIGTNTWVPKGDEKLLILHYTVHNPNPAELRYDWWDLRFTVVDGQDTNHDYIQAVAREGTNEKLSISLKPAQKIEVYAAVIVPANGVVPKLMVEREKNAPVIRYDLRGKTTPLPATIADEADSTGATVRAAIAVPAGASQRIGVFDMKIDQVAYVEGQLGRQTPKDGMRWLTATVTVKNQTGRPERYVWSDFKAELIDADGEKSSAAQTLVKASRDETTYGDVAPGEEARFRFLFPIPTTVTGKTIRLAEGKLVHQNNARVFNFELPTATP